MCASTAARLPPPHRQFRSLSTGPDLIKCNGDNRHTQKWNKMMSSLLLYLKGEEISVLFCSSSFRCYLSAHHFDLLLTITI